MIIDNYKLNMKFLYKMSKKHKIVVLELGGSSPFEL